MMNFKKRKIKVTNTRLPLYYLISMLARQLYGFNNLEPSYPSAGEKNKQNMPIILFLQWGVC